MIYLIRHTLPDIGPKICYGQLNVDVAGSFPTESKKIKKRVQGIRFKKVFASPLIRCHKLSIELFPLSKVIYDKRLMEMDFGKFEGISWDRIYQKEVGKEWFGDWVNNSCPGGESFKEVIHRVHEFIDEHRISTDDDICIITHGGIIRAFQVIFKTCDLEKVFNKKINFGEIITI